MEEVITGDNIGIVEKRTRIKKELCILNRVANNYSGLNMP